MATWTVDNLISYNEYDSKEKVVYAIEYTVSHSDSGNSSAVKGLINLDLDDLSSFTEYASISEANALAWAKAKIGSDEVSALETVVTKRVEEKNNTGVTAGKAW